MQSKHPIYLLLCIACILLWLPSCSSQHRMDEKIYIAQFYELNSQGLIGDTGSYRAISYEFCIPRNDAYVDVVKEIEPNIQIQRSSGRIGCTKEELLCLGHTDTHYQRTFRKLTSLPYINRIQESFFE